MDGDSSGGQKTAKFNISIFICVLAGSFQYGYSVSSVNGAALFAQEKLWPSKYIGSVSLSNQNATIDEPLCANVTRVDLCKACEEDENAAIG